MGRTYEAVSRSVCRVVASYVIIECLTFIYVLSQVLGQYIENLMAASNVFQSTGDSKGRKG